MLAIAIDLGLYLAAAMLLAFAAWLIALVVKWRGVNTWWWWAMLVVGLGVGLVTITAVVKDVVRIFTA